MNIMNDLYDIRSSEHALNTLVNLTNVSEKMWIEYNKREDEFKYFEDLVHYVTVTHGDCQINYEFLNFVFQHITTSSENCETIRKYGILDLKQAYCAQNSELNKFLHDYDIDIDLSNHTLNYDGKKYDISYKHCIPNNREEDCCKKIGRRFYSDYSICGFLSIKKEPYLGDVHSRPEILKNIDSLLGLNLSEKWILTHKAYEVIAKVSGKDIEYAGDTTCDEKEKIFYYLNNAYYIAFKGQQEVIFYIKKNVQIPARNITEIKPFSYW